ncbi:MAG: MarR family transcriptional regulator [Butyrivibrio sp.]|nr:MarR family transcriptional regulator [Acetatifactor muris]MCM1559058.1 MarR family transcriptional regulator [Butyrivibrio sp.]
MEQNHRRLAFTLRVIHNQIKAIIRNTVPCSSTAPHSQLQGGILGYLYHHQEQPVYQRDIEKEFRISGATATNTLQVMEKNGLIVRKALDKDARLKRILMTEEAMQGYRQVEEHMEMMEQRMIRDLSEEEIAELHRMLEKVFRNLEEWRRETGVAEPEEEREKGEKCCEDKKERM